MDRRQNDEEYRDSEQGRKALALALELTATGWKDYDFTKVPGADMEWPDLDDDKIGTLTPWLCVSVNIPEDWVDLNAIEDSDERKGAACARILGIPGSCATDEDTARAVIEAIEDADDFDEAAAEQGFQSTDLFTLEDHVRAVETHWDEVSASDEAPVDYQSMVDDAMKQQQQLFDTGLAAAEASGEMEPIHGITMEDWAAANAKMVQGVSMDELLEVLAVEQPQWDEANAEWNARMTRDFTISKKYADIFNNPDVGKFAGVGPKKATEGEPLTFEDYMRIQVHMEKGIEQGVDAQAILKEHGTTLSEWTTIQSYWSQQLVLDVAKYAAEGDRLRERFQKDYAGGGMADDIEF